MIRKKIFQLLIVPILSILILNCAIGKDLSLAGNTSLFLPLYIASDRKIPESLESPANNRQTRQTKMHLLFHTSLQDQLTKLKKKPTAINIPKEGEYEEFSNKLFSIYFPTNTQTHLKKLELSFLSQCWKDFDRINHEICWKMHCGVCPLLHTHPN